MSCHSGDAKKMIALGEIPPSPIHPMIAAFLANGAASRYKTIVLVIVAAVHQLKICPAGVGLRARDQILRRAAS
jgi:hypothetical protein